MNSFNILDISKPITFTVEENRQIDDFAKKIDILDSKFILNYASLLQLKIANLPDLLLKELKTDYSSEANEIILDLLSKLTSFTPDDSIFLDPVKNHEVFVCLRDKYVEISSLLSSLLSILQEQQLVFLQNSSMLKSFYKKGFSFYKKICMYIEAGERKLKIIEENELKTSNDAKTIYDAFKKEKISNAYSRLKTRLSALEKTKTLAKLFLVQVDSYLKNNSSSLKEIDKISKIIIPKWKNKIKLALRIGDLLEILDSTTIKNPKEFINSNKSLTDSISVLSQTLTLNNENRKNLDELYLIGKEIQKSLQS